MVLVGIFTPEFYTGSKLIALLDPLPCRDLINQLLIEQMDWHNVYSHNFPLLFFIVNSVGYEGVKVRVWRGWWENFVKVVADLWFQC